MLAKINRTMRKILFIIGPIFLILKLTENKGGKEQTQEEDFQTEEFDDIW